MLEHQFISVGMRKNNIWCDTFLSQPYGRLKVAISADYFAFQIAQPAVDIPTVVALHTVRHNVHILPLGGGFDLEGQRNNLISVHRKGGPYVFVLFREVLVNQQGFYYQI